MDNYKIFATNEFTKKLHKIPSRLSAFLENKLNSIVYPQLRSEPHYGHNIKKLTDIFPNVWRFRIGDFRIFYSINEQEKIVYVLTIEMRKDAY